MGRTGAAGAQEEGKNKALASMPSRLPGTWGGREGVEVEEGQMKGCSLA